MLVLGIVWLLKRICELLVEVELCDETVRRVAVGGF